MTIFDIHCHVFNGKILKDLVNPSRSFSTYPTVKDWKEYLKEFSSVFVNSEKKNNKLIISNLKKNFPNNTYATVPLMMDINFINSPSFEITDTTPTRRLVLDSNFQKQIKKMQQLSNAGNCYPFFAVDPRRIGVIDAIINGKYITRTYGGFYGIKLYPRLGYHPMADKLPKLYAYCANNNIPITTHCSAGGFPPISFHSGEFCNPENFRQALVDNPNLIINFAHFGNGNIEWGRSIVDLMSKFPNVYSDLSCHTGGADLSDFKDAHWSEDIVRQRTLYGSDFDIFYFTKFGMSMDDYIKAFISEFTESELVMMMSVLPQKFLGINT